MMTTNEMFCFLWNTFDFNKTDLKHEMKIIRDLRVWATFKNKTSWNVEDYQKVRLNSIRINMDWIEFKQTHFNSYICRPNKGTGITKKIFVLSLMSMTIYNNNMGRCPSHSMNTIRDWLSLSNMIIRVKI